MCKKSVFTPLKAAVNREKETQCTSSVFHETFMLALAPLLLPLTIIYSSLSFSIIQETMNMWCSEKSTSRIT
jgi:hypothetical protein